MNAILAPHGTATILLFRAQFDSELPPVATLRRELGTKHIRIYKSHRDHIDIIRQIERLCDHLRNFGKSSGNTKKISTHVIILPLGHYNKSFAAMVYTAELIGGFNLTTAALDELEEIDKKRWSIDRISDTAKQIRQTLVWSQETAGRTGISDPSLQSAIDQHDADFDPNYGKGVLREYHQQQQNWYERYMWRDRRDAENDDGGPTDQNGDSEPLAA